MTARWDIIVCGVGTAGMPAAIFAAQRGAKVLAIEHAPEIGGTLHYAAGQISAAGTRLQDAKGIQDSPDLHYDDIVRISNGQTDPRFARLIADNAADTLHWLLDLGWTPLPEHPVLFGQTPYSVPRTYWAAEAGVAILNAVRPAFEDAVTAGGVTVKTSTEVTDLMFDDRGGVRGVRTEDASGHRQEYLGDNVLLTTGGLGGAFDLFEEITGYPLFTWGWPWCRGAGIRFAIGAGGLLQHQEHFVPRLAGVTDPANPARSARFTDLSGRRPPWEIYVDRQGRRFVAEDASEPLARERALLSVPDLTFWTIYDQAIKEQAPPLFDAMPPDQVERWLGNHPAYCRAETLDALAAQAGIDPDGLRRSVEEYNRAVSSGSDPLGRRHLPRSIGTPPYYAIRHHGATSTAVQGIAVNERFQVLRADGAPIANLSAAGEILGMGLHSGDAFVGGMGLMPALTYGRMLGQKILNWETETATTN